MGSGLCQPIVQLLLQVPPSVRVLRQPFGPVLERGRLRRQAESPPTAELLVGRLQILQQDPPGDAIDHQVVDDDQQAARLVSTEVKEGNPQQRPLRQVQASL